MSNQAFKEVKLNRSSPMASAVRPPEAKALIIRHRPAVLAIANALMIHRTLDAVMIHKIIASAPEHARRAEWARVQLSAVDFAVQGFEG
jgi:hypothetical protein